MLQQILENRGISTEEQIDEFLNPDYGKLHDPFLFADMKKATARIWQAIDNKEKILIYSDYDADAITANAVLFRTLQFSGVKAEVYIPDRFTEGYGLNLEAFKKIKEQGIKLVITVDCGTNSLAEAEFCRENGIDLIITDHHEVTGQLPSAYALINPKAPGCAYPYKELTGVGVAFKLACALLLPRENESLDSAADARKLAVGTEKWLLDLVAIGTVADCHSLIGENRTLVKFGLKVLAKTKWIGLKQLLVSASLQEKALRAELDAYSIGFIIAPRINAAGRIDHASVAFDLLATDDFASAARLAKELENLNSRRQMLTENVISEAREQVALISERKILLVSGNEWPKGVVGLVAGKLVEEFSKPVLVLQEGSEESVGSARSVRNFNIVEALNFSKNFLVKYGGHSQAAGFTIKSEHIQAFYKQLLDYADTNLLEDNFSKVLEIETELSANEINMQNLEILEKFEPFGVDNTKPKFVINNVVIKEMATVGKDQKHLQMTVLAENGAQSPSAQKYFKCIGFNFGKAAATLKAGEKLDLAFEFLGDTWNGTKNLKLKLIDFRKAAANA